MQIKSSREKLTIDSCGEVVNCSDENTDVCVEGGGLVDHGG